MTHQMFRFTIDTNAQDLASQSLFSVFSINIKMDFMGIFEERSSEINSEEIFDIKSIIQFPTEDRSGLNDEKVTMIFMLLCLLGCLLLLFAMYIIKSIWKDKRNQRNPPYIHHQVWTLWKLSPPPPTYQEAIFGRRRSLFVPKPRKWSNKIIITLKETHFENTKTF